MKFVGNGRGGGAMPVSHVVRYMKSFGEPS